MPVSRACRTTGRACSSVSTQERHAGSPIPMAPSAMRDTLRLLRPSRTYCIVAVLGLILPHVAEARDLVGDPDKALRGVTDRRVLDREEQRHVGQIAGDQPLRLLIER